MVIIDLDDTLLNSCAMYEAAIDDLRCFGVTDKNFWIAEEKERHQRATTDRLYSFSDHISILSSDLKLNDSDTRKMREKLLDFIRKNSGNYLFSDAADFLFFFNKKVDLVIMTSGPQDLQRAKLDGIIVSGFDIKEYFQQIIIATKLKGYHANKICPLDNLFNIFIDDSPRQINSVAQTRPDIFAIWMNRIEDKVNKDDYKKVPNYDYIARNFYDVDNILSRFI